MKSSKQQTTNSPSDLRQRTKTFALRIMKLADALPVSRSGNAIASQIVRSGTSIGANYHSACRGRSKAEFTAKLGVSVEGADETLYWLELIQEAKLLPPARLNPIVQEAEELIRILARSHATARRNPIAKSKITKSSND